MVLQAVYIRKNGKISSTTFMAQKQATSDRDRFSVSLLLSLLLFLFVCLFACFVLFCVVLFQLPFCVSFLPIFSVFDFFLEESRSINKASNFRPISVFISKGFVIQKQVKINAGKIERRF